jgi:hypothetical protein
MFSRAERVELGFIMLGMCVLAFSVGTLPERVEVGSVLAIAALALLLQGLVRDVWLLWKQRRSGTAGAPEEARCMCVESTVGLAGVLVGVLLTALAVEAEVPIAAWAWPMAAGGVWGAGFLMKDHVIQWKPWKVRRVKDHGSILVRWR